MPALPEALAAKGALLRGRAQDERDAARRQAEARLGRDALRRALELNAHLQRTWGVELKKASDLSD